MNSPLETGLFLPIRFYSDISEQDRFKRTSEGVALPNEVYIFVDCKSLAPFQVIPNITDQWGNISTSVTGVTIDLVCINGDIVTLPYNAEHWEFYTNSQNIQYLSYLGTDDFSAFINPGTFYIALTCYAQSNPQDEPDSQYFVSDIFKVINCDDYYSTQNYRLTSPSDSDKRTIDGTNLRITTN